MALENPESLLMEAKERYTDRDDKIWLEKIEKWCKDFDFDGSWIFASIDNLSFFDNARFLFCFIKWCEKNDTLYEDKKNFLTFKSRFGKFESEYKNSVDQPQEVNEKEEKIVDEQNDFDDFEPDDSSVSLKLSDLENTLQELDQSEKANQIIEEIELIKKTNSTIQENVINIQQMLDGLNEAPEDMNETVGYLASKNDLDKNTDKIINTLEQQIRNTIENSFQSDKYDMSVRFKDWWREFKLKDCLTMFGMIVLVIVFGFGIHAIFNLL
jgi:hypothetical protein